ncbi:hypothetical protein CKM354_001272800 [Cercospora kikuchii]|uniref:Ubiquitin-like domain-containing protein n=1 Tax=Cercospora kikuchii TaxID=84275 RepID=A0A9P3FMK0_9PEZI|nr:uncharacterized protein CKM354_001272800 [Cercospora kikuchii]GIZ49701.1 hypothetical protein CKM354_001272800 [Cercospora kikuchii]
MAYPTAPPETFNITINIPLDRQTITAIKSGFFNLDTPWSQSKTNLATTALHHTIEAVKALPDLPPEVNSSFNATSGTPTGPFQLIVQDANGKRLSFVLTGQEAVQEIALRISMQTRITKKRMQLYYKGKLVYCGSWQGEQQSGWLRSLGSVSGTLAERLGMIC